MTNIIVAGVGMTKFCKPGKHEPYRVMAAKAIRSALDDAGLDARSIQQAYGAYIYGDSTCAQHAFYDVVQSGIPIVNVNNACASGSSALFLARQAVLSGEVDCALAFGFEEMPSGALMTHWDDRESPFGHAAETFKKYDLPPAPMAVQAFGAAGRHYMTKFGASADIFAKVSAKSRDHALRNPYSLFTKALTWEDVQNDITVYDGFLTRLMCCPPTCGAAATIVCSEEFARKNGISNEVKILSQVMATDTETSWLDPMNAVGKGMTERAAQLAYDNAGIGPEDVDVVELHDCFTTNEVIAYEALGLCSEGGASEFITNGDNTYGGKYVVGPSGGLMSKGHPIGATGLAQCTELTWHLRGQAEDRQVDGANIALQHNVGLGGAVVVTIYGK